MPPIHVNSIDIYVFQDLVGTIYISQQKVEILEREGVSGLGFRKCGTRGVPFEMKSITYHADFSAAATAMAAYTTLVGSGLVTIVRNDIGIDGFVVLSVSEASPPQALINVAGASGAQVRAEVKWKLVQA